MIDPTLVVEATLQQQEADIILQRCGAPTGMRLADLLDGRADADADLAVTEAFSAWEQARADAQTEAEAVGWAVLPDDVATALIRHCLVAQGLLYGSVPPYDEVLRHLRRAVRAHSLTALASPLAST